MPEEKVSDTTFVILGPAPSALGHLEVCLDLGLKKAFIYQATNDTNLFVRMANGGDILSEEKTVNTFFEVINSRNLKKMAELLDDDCEFYFPKTQPLIGKDRILRFFNILFRQYPELRFEVRRMILQGSNAAIHWTNQGHNRRRESYENEGVTIFEMADEKISFMSDFFKSTDQW